MPKPPAEFCIDSFKYHEYLGENEWMEPIYDEEGVTIRNCRIDRGAEYSSSSSGKVLLYNAVLFCYEGITDPLPEFKTESILHFDGIDHKLTKVIPIYEPYEKTIYSYELEVV